MLTAILTKLRGLKTYLVAGAAMILGIADTVGAIDITPLLHAIMGQRDIGGVMTALSIVFGVLRYATRGPAIGRDVAPVAAGMVLPSASTDSASLGPMALKSGVDAGE
jgi:hypothetical protein